MKWLCWLLLSLAICGSAAGAELLVFTAPWCGACKKFHGDLERDPDMLGGTRATFIDASDERAGKYRVRSLPTFVLEEGGREVRRTVGYSGPAALKRWLAGQ